MNALKDEWEIICVFLMGVFSIAGLVIALVFALADSAHPIFIAEKYQPAPQQTIEDNSFWEARMKEMVRDQAHALAVTYTIKGNKATPDEVVVYISHQWIESEKEKIE